jgi:lipoyl(octanoyl) transferase
METLVSHKTEFRDLPGIRYKQAWDLQTGLFNSIVATKVKNRDLPVHEQQPTQNFLLFCEHTPVYTLGKSGFMENLLLSETQLKERDIDFFHINRGGDITYHGPGQLTGYPIFDLENFYTDIGKYLRNMEEAIIHTIAEYGLEGGRIPGMTGVWLDWEDERKARKICAIGVHASRWVTMHGFGFNIKTDLSYFDHIVPCGIKDKGVTSLEKEVGPVDMEEVKGIVKEKFAEIYELEYL